MNPYCETCMAKLHVTPEGVEYGHMPPCEACEVCGARMKQKDNIEYCERWEEPGHKTKTPYG